MPTDTPFKPGRATEPRSNAVTLTARLRTLGVRAEEYVIPAPHYFPQPMATQSAGLLIDRVRLWAAGLAPDTLPARLRTSVPQRRHEFLAGRLCVESALAALGLPVQTVGQLPSGEPLWPRGVTGSITHNRIMAYAAVCLSGDSLRMGMDTEALLSGDALDAVMRTCCTPGERARFLSGDGASLTASVIFSGKESLYKVIGAAAGRVIDFVEVEVTAIDFAARQISFAALASDLPNLGHQCRGYFRFDGRHVHTSVIGL